LTRRIEIRSPCLGTLSAPIPDLARRLAAAFVPLAATAPFALLEMARRSRMGFWARAIRCDTHVLRISPRWSASLRIVLTHVFGRHVRALTLRIYNRYSDFKEGMAVAAP
jgi:hypothetical protein